MKPVKNIVRSKVYDFIHYKSLNWVGEVVWYQVRDEIIRKISEKIDDRVCFPISDQIVEQILRT